MIDEKVNAGETVIAVLKRVDGTKKVIRARWYSRILRRLRCRK